jgi:hypothetical protein
MLTAVESALISSGLTLYIEKAVCTKPQHFMAFGPQLDKLLWQSFPIDFFGNCCKCCQTSFNVSSLNKEGRSNFVFTSMLFWKAMDHTDKTV